MLDELSTLKIASVFDALNVGIILVDRQGLVAVWNEWMVGASHLPGSAVLGRKLVELFPQLRGTRLETAIEDSFQVGSSSILTHSLNNLLPLHIESGRPLLHNITVRPIASGLQQRCLLQIDDVTLFVTRERILRERQNARYHAIVDTAPDAIITSGADRAIQWLNRAAGRVWGYQEQELLGQKIDILFQNDSEAAAVIYGRGSANEKGSQQVLARRKDGTLAPFEVSFARWNSDDRIFTTTIWRDITDRVAAEAALRTSEAHQRALLEALPQLVWTCDPIGNCDYLNPQWEAYTGRPAAEHRGANWLNVVREDDRDRVEAAWKSALTDGSIFDVETRIRRGDGIYLWFKMRSIPVAEASGTLTRWFGTATDITELIEASEALRQSNEELEARVAERTGEREAALAQLYESQKMETIGQLTGGVAHDFNNLLAVILGSLTLLKKALPNDPRSSRLLDAAMQGAERGATLTKRLLAFARRQGLKLEAVDLKNLIADALDFLRQSVGPGIAVQVEIEPNIKLVKGDPNQLELALMNLAVNARDAMPAGGTLTIRCSNETIPRPGMPGVLPEGDYVLLAVSDTGTGMSEATRARAMEPFFTTKGIGKGTGLGLSMVHGMTAQSGGAMTIASELGHGTEIRLWLKCASAEDMSRVPAASAAPEVTLGRRKLRILLVDDDALVSMNTAYMLMDLGHSVLEAHSPEHALDLLRSEANFDLVITDYAMPGMNGLDLAMKIKASTSLPVVLATGYADLPENTTIEFPRVDKPYSQEQLAAVLDLALGTRKTV